MPDYPNLRGLADGTRACLSIYHLPALREEAKAALEELTRLRNDETKCHQRLIRRVAEQEIAIRRWRSLAYLLCDEEPCDVIDGNYCQLHQFPAGGSKLCPHAVAKQVLPDKQDFGPPGDFHEWVAETAEPTEA